MKMLMMVALLGGLIALGAWQMGYFEKPKPKEEPKIEAKAEEAKAPEATQVSDADKAKADAEAKAKAEADARAQGDKLKSEAEAKISELKKQYAEKKASYMALRKEKKTYEAALKDLESAGAKCVSIMPEYQSKAKDIIAQMKGIESQIAQQAKDVKKAKSNLTVADSFIGGQRDKKDRIGWRYTGSNEVHRMSEYNMRDKTKTVKFIYKEDTRKQDGMKEASSAHSKELAELAALKNKLSDLKNQASANKAQYKEALQNKINQLLGEMKSIKDEGKKLDDEIDKLKQG